MPQGELIAAGAACAALVGLGAYLLYEASSSSSSTTLADVASTATIVGAV
jgi:hypothetical protein